MEDTTPKTTFFRKLKEYFCSAPPKKKPYHEEWDRVLNSLLDNYEPSSNSLGTMEHSVILGPIEVWVSNYPYAYGHPWTPGSDLNSLMPSKTTIERLRQSVENELGTRAKAASAKAANQKILLEAIEKSIKKKPPSLQLVKKD